MQVRGLLVAALLLAALGGLVWWSNTAEKSKESKADPNAPPKIVEIPTDQVQQVEIVKGAETTTVKRGADGKWEIALPKPSRADQDAATTLVGTLNSLASERLIEEKASDLAAFGLNWLATSCLLIAAYTIAYLLG